LDGASNFRTLFAIGHCPKKLILAAADCAENPDAVPPPELALAWRIERWGASANYNGEIPMRLLRRMAAALNVYAAFSSYQHGSARLADWARHNPMYSKIVWDVRAMREQNA
jgi:hypothetical protein